MRGKPYLHIEIDEHSSGVGIITRVEAFINSLKNIKTKQAADIKTYIDSMTHRKTNIKSRLSDIDGKENRIFTLLVSVLRDIQRNPAAQRNQRKGAARFKPDFHRNRPQVHDYGRVFFAYGLAGECIYDTE